MFLFLPLCALFALFIWFCAWRLLCTNSGKEGGGRGIDYCDSFHFFPPLSLFVTSSLGNRVILLYRLDTTFCTGLSPLCLCYGFHLGFNFIALMSDPSTCEHGGTVCLGGRRR
ncbi:hypothetical protein BO99DRAFT_153531 [Aspergillus violaceofuscus CBS 115571]|uniref:Secreted peptide n=1 Tax=Aspergillus violaceofuscus (strain CBS 115571) TaxID=1450538 RepID=A0A2V5HJA7_ASPV1|nr:hypothetical protein BO99DRAFT_153531 [Aspergillus violaceofuscus CBS 115571]